MNFVFFDIECAGVSKKFANICVFGYCLTDEHFNIIEKEDILINPMSGFHLTDRKGKKGLVLPYDYNKFSSCPAFPEVYPKIRRLLTEGNIVLGHSVMNDVKYLNLETARFSLPPLEFSFYDTQFIYMNRANEFERQTGLKQITDELGVEYTEHRAADDAYASMRITEAICREEDKDFLSLISFYSISPGKTRGGRAYDCDSAAKKAHFAYLRALREEKIKLRGEFCRAVCGKRPALKSKEFCGNVFSFDRRLEEDPKTAVAYLHIIYERGGGYTVHSDRCNTYVARSGDKSSRRRIAEKTGAVVIDEEDLKELLNL